MKCEICGAQLLSDETFRDNNGNLTCFQCSENLLLAYDDSDELDDEDDVE